MKRSPVVMMMCDAPLAMGDDGGQLVSEGAKPKLVVPTPGAGMVRLGGDQVAASDQFVALDGGVVAKWPTAYRRRSWCSVSGHKQLTGFVLTARLALP